MTPRGPWFDSRRGYLYGPTALHLPVDPPAPPSSDPGFGAERESLCGRYSGIVYAASLLSDGARVDRRPLLPFCRWCERTAERLPPPAASSEGSPT